MGRGQQESFRLCEWVGLSQWCVEKPLATDFLNWMFCPELYQGYMVI